MVWNMKGNIEQLFRERFQGHEAPVAPGMWEAIQQQMDATAPAAADGVNVLFRERFAEHEVQMDASVWEGISKELGHVAPAVPGQRVLGWAAATAGVLVVAAGLWYLGTSDGAQEVSPALVTNVGPSQNPATEQPVADPAATVGQAKEAEPAEQGSGEERPASATRVTSSTTVPGPLTVRPADSGGDATPIDRIPNGNNTATNLPAAPVPALPVEPWPLPVAAWPLLALFIMGASGNVTPFSAARTFMSSWCSVLKASFSAVVFRVRI